MSALDQLREVMSAPHDLVEEYHTDTVSVTSTVEDELEAFYNAECIIAESLDSHYYLVKWEDYPLDQCTWEPPEHLEDTNLISKWEQAKQELGKVAFQRENEKNINAYEKAQEKAEAAKARKYAKREKRRMRLQRRKRTVVFDEDSSEEEPLATKPPGEGLFVEDEDPSVSVSSVKSPMNTYHSSVPRIRKAPLQQSSSEDESSSKLQTSNDSLMGELQRKRKHNGKRIEV